MTEPKISTQLHVPHPLMIKATAQARREGISRSELFRRAIAAWVAEAA